MGGLSSPQLLMSSKPIKIGATLVILGLAFAGLMYPSLSEGTEDDKHVDEVMSDPGAWHGKRLQLHGFVVDHSILRKPDTLDYRFQVQNNGKVVPVRYSGVVPDTFKGGAEVVLKGRLDNGGFTVDANGVMAKCPSKDAGEADTRDVGRLGTIWAAWAPSFCSLPSSPPATRLRRVSPARAAAPSGSSIVASAPSISLQR